MARIAGWNRPKPPKRRRIREFVGTANKKVLGAIGAGLLAIITTAVIEVPHWVAGLVNGPPPQLTAASSDSPNLLTSDECALGGSYFVTGGPTGIGPFSNSTIGPWLIAHSARPAHETTTQFTLQGAPDASTVVITGVHTVLLSRIPAPAGTQLALNPDGCGGVGPVKYRLSVDLDARNPTPSIFALNDFNQLTAQLPSLQITVDNNDPALIRVDATTNHNDVRWKLRVDYTVNGQIGHLFVPNDGSYQTTAVTGDPTATLNYNPQATPADAWSGH